MEDFISHIICCEVFHEDPDKYLVKNDRYELKENTVENINIHIHEMISKVITNYAVHFNIPEDQVTMKDISESDKSLEEWASN